MPKGTACKIIDREREDPCPEPSGRYDLKEFTMEGVSYSLSELETLGLEAEVYLTFAEDHTGLLYYGSEKMSFTWDSNSLTAEGDSLPYRFEDGKVILGYGNTEMVFEQAQIKGTALPFLSLSKNYKTAPVSGE